MLVAAGLVTEPQVAEALASQKSSGRRLGEALVELGYIEELQLTQVLSNQLAIPWVSLHRVEFSRELLTLIPGRVADEHGCIPIYKRIVRKAGETLFVAMEDPTSERSLAAIAEVVGMPIKPMVAPPTDIRNAIRAYYFGQAPRAPTKRATRHPASPDIEIEVVLPSDPPTPLEAPSVQPASIHPVSIPAPPGSIPPDPNQPEPAVVAAPVRKKKVAKLVTLTLLDGTTVRLPAPRSSGDEEEDAPTTLTANDLVAALLARAQGADVDDVLPDARWEALFGTLLSLLMRKGLIADWEFVEAWKKNRASG